MSAARLSPERSPERSPLSTTRRAWWWLLIFAGATLGLYLGLPQVAGLDDTWGRISEGESWWLVAALAFELCSYAGYVVLLRGVFARPWFPLRWRESYDVAMAGVAATRLFAAGGIGGIALTGWALSRAGLDRHRLARGLTTFYVALYGVFMIALVVLGVGLRTGVLEGAAPFGMTVVPAGFGATVIALALSLSLLPDDLERRLAWPLLTPERAARAGRWLGAAAAAAAGGVRGALGMVRRADPVLLGGAAWWALDIAVLWACFHAFGEAPPPAVIGMAYFTGMLGNLLPLPGGIGGVEGGMIAAFLAFGVPGGLAVVAVLSYRAFAFWLPTIPGLVSYLRLRRSVKAWADQPLAAEP